MYIYIIDFLLLIATIYLIRYLVMRINNYYGEKKFKIPIRKYIYYKQIEYYYKITGNFTGDTSDRLYTLRLYKPFKILGVKLLREVYTSNSFLESSVTVRDIPSFTQKLEKMVFSHQQKVYNEGMGNKKKKEWDGCLDEESKQFKKRKDSLTDLVGE